MPPSVYQKLDKYVDVQNRFWKLDDIITEYNQLLQNVLYGDLNHYDHDLAEDIIQELDPLEREFAELNRVYGVEQTFWDTVVVGMFPDIDDDECYPVYQAWVDRYKQTGYPPFPTEVMYELHDDGNDILNSRNISEYNEH